MKRPAFNWIRLFPFSEFAFIDESFIVRKLNQRLVADYKLGQVIVCVVVKRNVSRKSVFLLDIKKMG